jgi:hypothetical protein
VDFLPRIPIHSRHSTVILPLRDHGLVFPSRWIQVDHGHARMLDRMRTRVICPRGQYKRLNCVCVPACKCVSTYPSCVLSHETAAVTSVTGFATEKPFPPVASVFQCVRKSEQLLTSNSAVRRALLDKHGPDVTSLRVRGDNLGFHALI